LRRVCLHYDILKAFEKIHGERPDKLYPAPAYIEAKLEQVESGELRAETLMGVLSRDDYIKPPQKLSAAPDGDISFRAGEVKGKAPGKLLKLMGTRWELIRLRAPGKAYLSDHIQAICGEPLERLLGDEIYEYEVRDSNKETIYQPNWNQVLELDYQARKYAFKFVNRDGMTIKDALALAREDGRTIRKHFTLPISLSAAATANRPASGTRGRSRTPRRDHGQEHGRSDAEG
jgi:hypothetical protein